MSNTSPTFSVGTKVTDFAGYSLAGIDYAGRYVLTKSYSNAGITVARLDANGNLDLTFGQSGFFSKTFSSLSQDSPSSVLINSDNSIVVVGDAYHSSGTTNRYRVEAIKLTSTGALASNFGTGGLVSFETNSGMGNNVGGALLDPQGKILNELTHEEFETTFTIHLPELRTYRKAFPVNLDDDNFELNNI
jgi:hypothetical protein